MIAAFAYAVPAAIVGLAVWRAGNDDALSETLIGHIPINTSIFRAQASHSKPPVQRRGPVIQHIAARHARNACRGILNPHCSKGGDFRSQVGSSQPAPPLKGDGDGTEDQEGAAQVAGQRTLTAG